MLFFPSSPRPDLLSEEWFLSVTGCAYGRSWLLLGFRYRRAGLGQGRYAATLLWNKPARGNGARGKRVKGNRTIGSRARGNGAKGNRARGNRAKGNRERERRAQDQREQGQRKYGQSERG